MRKRYVRSIAVGMLTFSLIACNGGGGGGGSGVGSGGTGGNGGVYSQGTTLAGVAATGAPISGGRVEVKGADGKTASTKTKSDGTYAANVKGLTPPFLIRVEAITGEKYISVASDEDFKNSRPVNITPLTHTIVANVFQNANADELFSNFVTKATEFSVSKLETEKNELKQKFIDAGLLGDSGIVGADVDLMNGAFVANTSKGIDGLLDVIQVNTDSTDGIKIKLKGSNKVIITDKVDGTPDLVDPAVPAEIEQATAQLSVLDKIRAKANALAALNSSKSVCSGKAKDDGSACDVDNLYNAFKNYFHEDFNEDGANKEQGIWGWFCRVGDDEDATSREECLTGEVELEKVSLKDVTLLKYDETTGIAAVNFNVYIDGELEGQEEMALKKNDAGDFQLLGNLKTFRYWIDTQSVFRTNYTAATDIDEEQVEDIYSINMNFYYNGHGKHNFVGGESFTMTALSGNNIFPGDKDNMSLYLVKGPVYDDDMNCSTGLTFATTDKPYKSYDENWQEFDTDFATACSVSMDACDCYSTENRYGYFDFDNAQKVSINASQLAAMDKSERISLVGSGVNDEFSIQKPLVLNEYNASKYAPEFGMSAKAFCTETDFDTTYTLSVQTGRLDHISLYMGYGDGMNRWENENLNGDLEGKTYVYKPEFQNNQEGDIIFSRFLYLSSDDDYYRRFIREVSCM